MSTSTKVYYVLQGFYVQGNVGGWEDLTAHEDIESAREDMAAYRENEGGAYRIRRRIERTGR